MKQEIQISVCILLILYVSNKYLISVCMHECICVCVLKPMWPTVFYSTSCNLIQYYTPVTLNGQNVLDHFPILVRYAPLFDL